MSCSLGRHCVSGHSYAAGAPACGACLAACARSVRALARDYDDLDEELVRHRQGVGDTEVRPSNKPESRPPVAAHIWHLRDEIRWQVATWEIPVRVWAYQPLPRRTGVRPRWVVETATAFLANNVQAFSEVPMISGPFAGPDAPTVARSGRHGMLTLSRLHERVRAVVGQSDLVIHLPGDCPRCGAWALRRVAGTDSVWCGMCRETWPYEHYQEWVAVRLTGGSPLDPREIHIAQCSST